MDTKSDSDTDKLNTNEISEVVTLPETHASDSQDTFCEVMSPKEDVTFSPSKEECSQSIFSQETFDYSDINKQVEELVSSDSLQKSSEVTVVSKPVDLVILETETDSTIDKSSIITVSDSSENNKCDRPQPEQQKSPEHSSSPSKKSCSIDYQQDGSSTSMETTPTIFKNTVATPTSRSHSPSIPLRSSPRTVSKRSNSCNICCESTILKPARRLKRSLSADVDIKQKRLLTEVLSPIEFKKMITKKIKKSENVEPALSLHIGTIEEENPAEILKIRSRESQEFFADSQNIQLFLSPSPNGNNHSVNDGEMKVKSDQPIVPKILESVEEQDKNQSNDIVMLSDSNNLCEENSSGEIQKLSSIHGQTSHNSTVSVDIDSPYTSEGLEKSNIKSKAYLSNGYSSSTPENAPFAPNILLKKTFHVSDSEGDNTPPFTEFNRLQQQETPKHSMNSKSDSSNNRTNSISPVNNGHYSNTSNPSIPTFNVQMYSDENNEFLSLLVVKADNEMGNHTFKEYQRLSRRLTIDPYAADSSKSTSPSSITSGGLLQLPAHPRSSFMSTTSTSSTSSSRTSDGAFVIPARPKKSISFHAPTTVKGWQALKQSLIETISSLAENYNDEDMTQSPPHVDNKIPTGRQPDNDRVENSNNDIEIKGYSNDCNRTTPKSSKKKVQTKTKRVLSNKVKRNDLSITNEEPSEPADGIYSPEMISTEKTEPLLTPFRIDKLQLPEENNSSPKSTPRGRKLKTPSSAVNLSSKESLSTISDHIYPRGTIVLAKWSDKRYYSGKVVNALDNNKYEIKFDDGQSKTILEDFIIFGNMSELPLAGQSVYSKVDDHTYEPSLVLSVERNENGTVCYKCTTDRNSMISVLASDIYLTEDQAKSFRESSLPKSPHSAPGTPRRRINRELDLDNIIQGPRSARLRDKSTKGSTTPSSPKAGTSSGVRGPRRIGVTPQRRQESESSEGGDSRASSGVPEDVEGVQPELQKTPRKTQGIKVRYIARDLQIKGTSKQKPGKASKLTKFEDDTDTIAALGPIPNEGSTFFSGLHFLLTCTEMPLARDNQRASPKNWSDSEQYTESSSDENLLEKTPFLKERLEEQLIRAGGIVHNRFEDIPKNKYSVCRLIVPRPCLTAKYIMCLAANIRAFHHLWVIHSCQKEKQMDFGEYIAPTGFSIERDRFVTFDERNNAKPYQDKLILICSDNNSFTKFWDRVCSLAGANTKIINDDDMELGNSIAIVTEPNCPDKVKNKAVFECVPLISTTWVVQCLIEGKILNSEGHQRYHFAYNDSD